ncbi:cyclopropane-fatty-acyl-phospholipid synthase family protein [uncultured Pseudacidovorax sp.]|uniref:SAM-dependent methyltransferase n=1 Tax=uncultured Pseudacidovorax sp. TaxID=679313 RepID=UPI0025FD5739|nr:class I SAM-dependent methyltransferase [uncultured Pseudacidovorax sp.]
MAAMLAVPSAWAQARGDAAAAAGSMVAAERLAQAMVRLAALRTDDHLLDLGTAEGRVVVAAAQAGARATGVETEPELLNRARQRAAQAGVADRVAFREDDLLRTPLSGASVIVMHLPPESQQQLRPALLRLTPGTRVISDTDGLPGWPAEQAQTVELPDRSPGRLRTQRIYLWRVPAPVDGEWCAPGGIQLSFRQSMLDYQATLSRSAGTQLQWRGRIEGASLPPPVGGALRPWLIWIEGELQVRRGIPELPDGIRLVRRPAAGCPS